MIEQKLKSYFNRFTAVTPRAEFVSRSRSTVTTCAQVSVAQSGWVIRLKETLTAGSALALASFMLLAVLGGISYITKQGKVTGSVALNNDALVREATSLSFKVQLQDAEYFDESASQVVRALDRLSSDQHLIQ